MIELMAHQSQTRDFLVERNGALVTSDPGTGKTIASLAAYDITPGKGRLLVVAPLSILGPSWEHDAMMAFPKYEVAIAHGSPSARLQAFRSKAKIVVINHDGVKWIADNQPASLLKDFSHLIVDEFTAFKTSTAARTKAMRKIAAFFEYRWMMCGTPTPKSVLDLWPIMMMVDGGKRLGESFYRFRDQVCYGQFVAPGLPHKKWVDKPDAELTVSSLLRDITIRHTKDECLDLPPNHTISYEVEMPPQVMKAYWKLQKDAMVELEQGEVSAIHAGAKIQKMLQLLSGCVYSGAGEVIKVHPHRHELVLDLVEPRQQCIVAFNWQHEVESLKALTEKRGWTYGEIHGAVPAKKRTEYVDAFQRGDLRIMFCHPQAAAHGLTLTAGTSTIWTSPTYRPDLYIQLNARIDRKGQTMDTETIRVAAKGTVELGVYDKLGDKLTRIDTLLKMFAATR